VELRSYGCPGRATGLRLSECLLPVRGLRCFLPCKQDTPPACSVLARFEGEKGQVQADSKHALSWVRTAAPRRHPVSKVVNAYSKRSAGGFCSPPR